MAPKHDLPPLPEKASERATLVGVTVYGPHFLQRLAAGMGIARTTLWQLMHGRAKRLGDIDDRLIELLDAESDAAAIKGMEIAALRRRFLKWRRTDA